MDEFLMDIHTLIYKKWILMQKSDEYDLGLKPHHEDTIIIETDYCYGEIVFNAMNIIELSVMNTYSNEAEFYLHFQMKTMKHAIELFYEMLTCIKKLVTQPVMRILLSCSGGMTTSYFAQKMNQAAQLLFMNYEADAVGYNNLFNIGHKYDVILLAPQISYMHAKVQEIFKNQIVLQIPPQVFAKYDVGKTLFLIKEAQNKMHPHYVKEKPLPVQTDIHCHIYILSLSIFRNSERIHIAYRLYGHNNRIYLNKEIIKTQLSIKDLYDIIDTVIIQYPQIKMIGISIPGIINNGCVTSTNIPGFDDINLKSLLSSRYHQTIILGNDVNTAAVGYYASQNAHSSLAFIFQPIRYYAGAGIIINGQLWVGQHHLAGEVQYLPMKLSDNYMNLNQTPEGCLQIVSQMIASIVAIISPEVIALSCELIPHIDDLKKELLQYLPPLYIPEIVKIDNALEYTILGQMILCLQYLEE